MSEITDPHELASLLLQFEFPAELPQPVQHSLILRGIVSLLHDLGDEVSINALAQAALHSPFPAIQTAAFTTLTDLAVNRNPLSVESLFNLALQNDFAPARTFILANKLQSANLNSQVMFFVLTKQKEELAKIDPTKEILTNAYCSLLAGDHSFQNRILQAAQEQGFDHWVLLARALFDPNLENLHVLVAQYSRLDPQERLITLRSLEQLARQGVLLAQDCICQLYIDRNEAPALEIAIREHYLPVEPADRALLLFLSSQWHAYEEFDFSHKLLSQAFETAQPDQKRRILDHSRYTGQTAWMQSPTGSIRSRWAKDLSDQDWEYVISGLEKTGQSLELYRLFLVAPPMWGAKILKIFRKIGWRPPDAEPQAWLDLLNQAEAVSGKKIDVFPQQEISTSIQNSSALVVSHSGEWLASGGSSTDILLWTVHAELQLFGKIIAPVPVIRAAAFSPRNDYLAVAGGDDQIRIVRLSDLKIMKTLAGHDGVIRSLAFHPDGRSLVSASFDGTIRIWRFPHGGEMKKLVPSRGEIFALALFDGGEILASTGSDQCIHLSKFPEGTLIQTLNGHSDTITLLAATDAGQILVSAARDGSLRVWNGNSGQCLDIISNLESPATALILHESERIFATADSTGWISLWSISNSVPVARFKAGSEPIYALSFLPENRLVSINVMGHIQVWNLDLLWTTRTLLDNLTQPDVLSLKTALDKQRLIDANAWAALIESMLRWKHRFDVIIDQVQSISVGEFDIQL